LKEDWGMIISNKLAVNC